jgi:hypothetical protein
MLRCAIQNPLPGDFKNSSIFVLILLTEFGLADVVVSHERWLSEVRTLLGRGVSVDRIAAVCHTQQVLRCHSVSVTRISPTTSRLSLGEADGTVAVAPKAPFGAVSLEIDGGLPPSTSSRAAQSVHRKKEEEQLGIHCTSSRNCTARSVMVPMT